MPDPFTKDVKADLEKRISELIEFANEHHISGPDLLWNLSACIVGNMHAEIASRMRMRIF